jgi:cobalt/nickel transport system permease protein
MRGDFLPMSGDLLGLVSPSSGLPFAVHIADNILRLPWVAGGFTLMALLAWWGARRVRDEEIPRIALLAAAFFVASLIHFKLGPTSVHLLLNGLLGVMLGRRAALAIPVALFLQAALAFHGGLSSLGVNACVMTLPALLAGACFVAMERSGWARHGWPRTLLAGVGMATAVLGVVFFVVLVATNRWDRLVLDITPALRSTSHPVTLSCAAALGIAAARVERRLRSPPEFALGLVTGVIAVLATVVLNALVLLLGGMEEWHQIVTLVIVAHLPLAFIEGVVLGFTVRFLARVRPDLIGLPPQPAEPPTLTEPSAVCRTLIWLLALLGLPLLAGPAYAHRLNAEYSLLPDGRVRISSWFAITGDPPEKAKVEVFSPADHLLTEGALDGKGEFVFQPPAQGIVHVVVSAGAGHRAELTFTQGQPAPPGPSTSSRQADAPLRDVLLGVTFMLAVAAFVLSVRNARRLR